MSNNTTNPSIEREPLPRIQHLLAGESLSESDLRDVAVQLSIFSDAARDASQTALCRGSVILSQLLELATIWSNQFPDRPQLFDEILEFVRQNVATLTHAANSSSNDTSEVEAFVESAQARWSEYLEFLGDDQSQCDSQIQFWQEELDPSNSEDPACSADQESHDDQILDDVSVTPNSQIDLLLAAISNADDETPESDERPSLREEEDTDGDIPSDPVSEISETTTQDATFDLINDNELLEAFLDDAVRCLDSMEKCTMAVEATPEDTQSLTQFCRELHTLKGASASVGLSDLATYLHNLESSLDASSGQDPIQVKVESMFTAVDRMRAEITRLGSNGPGSEGMVQEPTRSGNDESPQSRTPDFCGVASADQSLIRIRASKLDRLMDMLAELVVLRNRRECHATEFNEINEELTRCVSRLSFAEEHPHAARLHGSDGFGEVSLFSGSRTLTELAKDITVVSRSLRELQKPVMEDNLAISHFIRDFRQELMQLRRMPVSGLFNRLQRAARDAAKAENKRVKVEIVGDDAGLEQELQERLYEPLLHIVRNAVSHGIEPENKRLQNGKQPCGTITLESQTSPQLLVIEVRDDGHGLDYDAIRRRANEKGILVHSHTTTNEELGKLIFHPGFSTRDQASEVSGRGVGMDVVATTLDQMRGRIEIDSKSGQGTNMRLSIPLRSGIEHVMVFRSAGQLFALPMQTVTAAKSIQACDTRINKFSLAAMLSLPRDKHNPENEVLILRKPNGRLNRKSVSQNEPSATERIGLEVDEIVGPEEVVVRGLPSVLKRHPLFCGVTLSGAGETVLLLDSNQLTEFYQKYHSGNMGNQLATPNVDGADALPVARRVLVIDDSLSARKMLIKKLNKYGFAAVEAGDGIEGLERMRHDTFELVFTDLDMPRLGGMEMLFDIQRGNYGDAPVVVVSSRNEDEFRFQALDHGAVDYLTKPVSDKSLHRLLTDLKLIGPNS